MNSKAVYALLLMLALLIVLPVLNTANATSGPNASGHSALVADGSSASANSRWTPRGGYKYRSISQVRRRSGTSLKIRSASRFARGNRVPQPAHLAIF